MQNNQNLNNNRISSQQLRNFQMNQRIERRMRSQIPDNMSRISNESQRIPQPLRNALIQHGNMRRSDENSRQSKVGISRFNHMIMNTLSKKAPCSLCETASKTPLISISSCNHKFCLNCLIQYVTFKVNLNEDVFCPQEECNLVMDQNTNFFQDLPDKILDKYNINKLWRQNINNPNVRLCPRQDCKEGLIDMLTIPPLCRKCRKTFCIDCQMEAHEGPCQDIFQKLFTEWKRCPNCGIFIQKIDGCNQIVCRCQHQFCYICLSSWTNQHYECELPEVQLDQNQQPFVNVRNPAPAPRFRIDLILRCIGLIIVSPILFIILIILLPLGGIIGGLVAPIRYIHQIGCPQALSILYLFPFVIVDGIGVGAQQIWDLFFDSFRR